MIQAACKGFGLDAICFWKETKQLGEAKHLVLIFSGCNILIFQLAKLCCFIYLFVHKAEVEIRMKAFSLS